jgi:hypothetical protein
MIFGKKRNKYSRFLSQSCGPSMRILPCLFFWLKIIAPTYADAVNVGTDSKHFLCAKFCIKVCATSCVTNKATHCPMTQV